MENRKLHMLLNDHRVKEEMYPKSVLDGSVKSLRFQLNSSNLNEKLKDEQIYGLQGSFRKLEID